MTPRFIVMEGPDGSGTTRHSQFLKENLERMGISVLLTSEPTNSSLGSMIRTLLKQEATIPSVALQLLFCADRAAHVHDVILPALADGKTVISDRYALSTIVYGKALGIDETWLTEINNHFVKPDLTIVTLPPFEVCMERIQKRDEQDAFENEGFQRKIYYGYKSIQDSSVIFVDTSGEKEDVAEQIIQLVSERFQYSFSPVNNLQ